MTVGHKSGIKLDADKLRYDLLCLKAIEEQVKVLTYGAVKYSPNGWKKVQRLRNRYYAAALRHIVAWRGGEPCDAETGYSHLAHALCCLSFLLEKELSHDKAKRNAGAATRSSVGVRLAASRKRAAKPRKAGRRV